MSLPGVDLPAYPDAELVVAAVLDPAVAPTGTRTPADLEEESPYIRAVRTGGADDGVTDRPVMGITTYAHTRAESWALSRAAQQRLLAAGGTAPQVGDTAVLIDAARTYTGPLEVPDLNPDERAVTTYIVLEFRRPRR